MLATHGDTHGDTPMCQILYANIKAKRSKGPERNLHNGSIISNNFTVWGILFRAYSSKTESNTGIPFLLWVFVCLFVLFFGIFLVLWLL